MRRIFPEHFSQRHFKLAVAGVLALVVLGFVGYELKKLKAPELVIREPAQDMTISSDVITARGNTDADADVTINARPLYSGESGEFEERVFLVRGVNELIFQAKNRYGKTTTVTRYVIVR